MCLFCRWKEGLRGGYLLPNMNFSMEDKGSKEKCERRQAVRREDWSKFIRICGRGLETRAIPSKGALQKLCEDFSHPPGKALSLSPLSVSASPSVCLSLSLYIHLFLYEHASPSRRPCLCPSVSLPVPLCTSLPS